MQRYLSLRVQTALYLCVFFLGLHHVFVFFTNASIMKDVLDFSTANILSFYGISSIFGICMYLALSRSFRKKTHTKGRIYTAVYLEMLCLAIMYLTTATTVFDAKISVYIYITTFIIHHIITPYILFNLDKLFEDYTHIQDRGKGRGIYSTMWNIPFVVVPLMLSGLNTKTLPITYAVAFSLLLPFLLCMYSYIQNPVDEREPETVPRIPLTQKIKNFWMDRLDRNSFVTQSSLHLYYGATGILLPIYLYHYFNFEWTHIGMLLAVITTPFVLVQIPFGKLEDKFHNDKQIFFWGIFIAFCFTIAALLVPTTLEMNTTFLLLTTFLFLSRIGCSMIEISSESMFYKHVTERDEFALLAFRAGRLVPYSLGILFLLI